jgi:hypothetical protein
LVRLRDGSPYWQTDFTVAGKRVRESTERTDWEEADLIAAQMRHEMLLALKQKQAGKRPEMRLDEACAKYWSEHAEGLATTKCIKHACGC